MSTGYQIKNQEAHHLTLQVVGWIDEFTRQLHRVESFMNVEIGTTKWKTGTRLVNARAVSRRSDDAEPNGGRSI